MFAPPAAASSHLGDEELFAATTPAQVKHLADCTWCRGRQDDALASTTGSDSDEDFERVLQAGSWRAEFELASREAVLPDRVRALMSAPAIASDVEPGQLWRLTWRSCHMLVAVIGVADWQVLSAPVTTDVKLADELTLLVGADRSPLATELAIWVRSRAAIPLFVFDRPIGTLPLIGSAQLTGHAALQQLVRAHLSDSTAPSHLPVGSPLTENDIDRIGMHDALWEQTDWFTGAGAGLIDSDGRLASASSLPDSQQSAKPLPLSDLVRRAGLSLPEFAKETGIKMSRLVDLNRPGAMANAEEITAIETLIGEKVEIDHNDLQLRTITALIETSRPALRAARRRWTIDNHRDAEPEDPIPLVTYLMRQPIAARSIHHEYASSDQQQQLRQYWRERLAMILSDYGD